MIRFSFWKDPLAWGLKEELEGRRVSLVAKTRDAVTGGGDSTLGVQRQAEEMHLKVISEMKPRGLAVLDWTWGKTKRVVKEKNMCYDKSKTNANQTSCASYYIIPSDHNSL